MYQNLKFVLYFLAISHISDANLEEVGKKLPIVKSLMGAVGGVEVIPESLMNAAGAISGSGPAYVSLMYINDYVL